MFKELDPILHSQLRLAVISLLISVKEAEFTFLKDKTGATAGNATVTYSLSTGCIATTIATVNGNPTVITGNVPVCIGLTTTLNSTPE